MAKYDALRRFLEARTEPVVCISFEELDAVVGGLPRSARVHRQWWENGTSMPHSQTRGWLDAGFCVESVDLGRGVVSFARTRN